MSPTQTSLPMALLSRCHKSRRWATLLSPSPRAWILDGGRMRKRGGHPGVHSGPSARDPVGCQGNSEPHSALQPLSLSPQQVFLGRGIGSLRSGPAAHPGWRPGTGRLGTSWARRTASAPGRAGTGDGHRTAGTRGPFGSRENTGFCRRRTQGPGCCQVALFAGAVPCLAET